MQVVAYKALDGELFEDQNEMQRHNREIQLFKLFMDFGVKKASASPIVDVLMDDDDAVERTIQLLETILVQGMADITGRKA
ncbi:hypothetical protein [Anaerotalea alkaliphila]|uniref:Uncharacterized protein n=1 Tax=Anaerotalea alkaliphila TaxID=2662126 RepID=A0A7X5HXI9_9FIRM|nr:hypothetical protein [Anaerotalea alkaliphila]NDL68499.1 hypothetical protein [Anaerotalea alkaliphila]